MKNTKDTYKNLYLREIAKKDKSEVLAMIAEINNSNDYEKFEEITNLKVNENNYDEEINETYRR